MLEKTTLGPNGAVLTPMVSTFLTGGPQVGAGLGLGLGRAIVRARVRFASPNPDPDPNPGPNPDPNQTGGKLVGSLMPDGMVVAPS